MATQKQIDANRRNALKSTGPVSEAGKNRSRRNSLKHGLAGSGLVLPEDDREAVETRMAEWNSSLKPFDAYEIYLLEVVAVESLRIDRCRIHERVLRDEQISRAHESWDDDLRQKADELASKLGKDPSVASKLRGSIPGASILLDHWHALSRILENDDWTPLQETFALDLLGTPLALRHGAASPFHVVGYDDALKRRREVVDLEIRRLTHLISEVLPLREANERDLLKAGLPDLDDRALRLLHRYESRCFRRLTWATTNMRCRHRTVTNGMNSSHDSYSDRPLRNVVPPPEPVRQEPPRRPEPPVYRRPSMRGAMPATADEQQVESQREFNERVVAAMLKARDEAMAAEAAKMSGS